MTGVGGPSRDERRADEALVNATLMVLGALAVIDNVVFHWWLEFHRFKDGWPGSIYVETALVLVGAGMVTVGALRERRARRARPRSPPAP